jgi:hypothetical protein
MPSPGLGVADRSDVVGTWLGEVADPHPAAIVSWRTRSDDVRALCETVEEAGERLSTSGFAGGSSRMFQAEGCGGKMSTARRITTRELVGVESNR